MTFSVEGYPVSKGRPRFARRGAFVKTYTDARTLKWEDQVKKRAMEAMGSSEPLETPVSLCLYFRLPIPRSYSKSRTKDALDGFLRPSKKPDWDNLGKAISDALNGVVFKDDAQVVSAHIKKTYAMHPGVDIFVSEEIP